MILIENSWDLNYCVAWRYLSDDEDDPSSNHYGRAKIYTHANMDAIESNKNFGHYAIYWVEKITNTPMFKKYGRY